MQSFWNTFVKRNLCHLTWKFQILLPTIVLSAYYCCYKRCCYETALSTIAWDEAISSSSFNPSVFLLKSTDVPPKRYEVCPDGDTICPMGNVCCGSLCLSGGTIDDNSDSNHNNNTNATCCMTDGMYHRSNHFIRTATSSMTTGCGVNYMCSSNNITMCTAVTDHHDPPIVPFQIPRTKLCHFTWAMTHIYALPMLSTTTMATVIREENEKTTDHHDDRQGTSTKHSDKTRGETSIPVATYLSTMGPIHEDEDRSNTNASVTIFENITRVVILIHGSRRNVEDYLCCVNAAIPTSSSSSSSSQFVDANEVLILAPFFPTEDDGMINITTTISQKSNSSNRTGHDQWDILRWIGNNNDPFQINHIFHTWRYGAGAINHPNISSYDVVDHMVTMYLYNRTKFPALQHIIVTGHSAGGQYVQRWALLSNSIHNDVDTTDSFMYDHQQLRNHNTNHNDPMGSDDNSNATVTLLSSSSVSSLSSQQLHYPVVHTVVANPKSYAYLDARRWMNTTLDDTDTNRSSTLGMEFRIPTDSEISHCWTYNDWEWGFDHRSNGSELIAPYVSNAIEIAGGIDVVIQRYAHRHLIYLSGNEDILFNGDCNDHLQGPNRRTRSERYYDALQQYYPPKLHSTTHRHERWIVPNVPHNHCLMYQSIQGQQALFGKLPKV